ncbi:MAG TPA: cytochrome d ubiquinol oxidase subunit II, partial [Anaeromyxobacteraceae bacterium]|nr:cytochrome d ubiquinol oxidase subunit II [Anaeromyxobacteraceae bacterium]
VWLLTGGGALFAAFPPVYATVFSGFYLALMLLLLALIARAVSLEFRGLVDSEGWRRVWDWAFGLGSILPSVLFGVAVGNILRGVPIGPDFEWKGSFLGLLNPYSLLVGLVSCALFAMHGALYLRMKTEGALASRLKRIALGAFAAFLALYAAATASTVAVSPSLFHKAHSLPFGILTALLLVALVVIPLATRAGRPGLAFAGSAAAIALMIFVSALSTYPVLVPSRLGLEGSLTIYNASSTPRTLATMLAIAVVGVPIVLGYTIWMYRTFKGPVRHDGAYSAGASLRAG